MQSFLNVQKYQSGCPHGAPCVIFYTPAWAFDFDTSAVDKGSHLLRILLTDIAGHVFEARLTVPGSGFVSQEFTNNNP